MNPRRHFNLLFDVLFMFFHQVGLGNSLISILTMLYATASAAVVVIANAYHRFVVVFVDVDEAETAATAGCRIVVHCDIKQVRCPVRRPLIAI